MNKFESTFQEFVYVRTYARWLDKEKRRETWTETVDRYMDFMQKKYGDKILNKDYKDVRNAILKKEVMPSMRALWSAGKAADKDNFAIYNCAFLTIKNISDFSELLYILMNGTGVGFSVERKFTNELPVINDRQEDDKPIKIVFEDSKFGWAKGFDKVLKCLWKGIPFECDVSKIRPKGARLKTFGGRASGPEPLLDLIRFTENLVLKNEGTRLQPIDVHDICCKIAEIVVVGGVRRSAEISLSDLTDTQMANAKYGEFWNESPQRMLSNNSVAYTRKPDIVSFLDEWKSLYRSKSGERGIFNRTASQKKASENQRRDGEQVIGINPCGEILLRDKQLCNLTEAIVRPDDTFETLKEKVRIATMLGTWQSGFTDFKFVNKKWKENCEEERLLGVSLSGSRDNLILGTVNDKAKKWLSDLKHVAIATNKKVALKLDINRSAAITCVKPSGTVSLLVNCAPGAHVRRTKTGFYIRRIRISSTDPLFHMLKDQGIKYEVETGQHADNCDTYVLEFPMKAPKGAKTKKDQTAQEQLEYWQMFRSFWCEHNPSITVDVQEHEWVETAAWVYEHFDEIGGLAFLPETEYGYLLAPHEDIDEETYERLLKEQPEIDFSQLQKYEIEDLTQGSQELACSGSSCEII